MGTNIFPAPRPVGSRGQKTLRKLTIHRRRIRPQEAQPAGSRAMNRSGMLYPRDPPSLPLRTTTKDLSIPFILLLRHPVAREISPAGIGFSGELQYHDPFPPETRNKERNALAKIPVPGHRGILRSRPGAPQQKPARVTSYLARKRVLPARHASARAVYSEIRLP